MPVVMVGKAHGRALPTFFRLPNPSEKMSPRSNCRNVAAPRFVGTLESDPKATTTRQTRDTMPPTSSSDVPDNDETFHRPVMVDEVVDWLDCRAGGRYVDGTVGGGGHAAAILEASAPEGELLGIDRDPEAISASESRLGKYGDRVTLVRGNYADASEICAERGFEPVDGLLVDAGVSSHQVDSPERGFSLRREGPLDMRMGPDAERVDVFLERTGPRRLAEILREYGELEEADKLARELLLARREGRLETTTQLAEVVRGAGTYTRAGLDPAVLVFQALRIAVNEELECLQTAVERVPQLVRPGGHAVFISFHSLEDRIVKHGFRKLARECVCPPDLPVCGCDESSEVEVLTSSPVRPADSETEENPRARSARLRAIRVRETND
jgi:16S rRNA (cytosine1402-N4)-methyltransferase